jgi:sec-independent protein translocase protein TatA
MGEFSIYHWLIVLLVLLLLFGRKKIPELMRGLGEGVRLFRDGITRSDTPTNSNDGGDTPKQN